MPPEAWTAIGAVVVAIITVWLGPIVVARIKRRDPPPPATPGDRALDDLFDRVDRLEAEITRVRCDNTRLREERAALKAELVDAKRRHVTDEDTIRTLRQRVDDLVRVIEHGGS